MTQRISFGNLGASGMVGVLFVIGVALVAISIMPDLGYLAIFAAVMIGILYAGLGALGIMRRQGLF